MRTTLRLDDRLFREVKKLAVETGRTFAAVVEDGLRQLLARRRALAAGKPVELPVCGGRGLQPGLDLDDSAALLERMDARA